MVMRRAGRPRWIVFLAGLAVLCLVGTTWLTALAQPGTPSTEAPNPPEELFEPPPEPTSVPPTPEPPPPTAIPLAPTDLPPEPTSIPADEASIASTEPIGDGDAQSAADAPAPVPNADAIASAGAVSDIELVPAGEATLTFQYAVTTPRESTAIHAELRYADGTFASSWELLAQAGSGGWSSGSGLVDVTEQDTLVPGTTFLLTVVVRAPADVADLQRVTLHVRSTVTTLVGDAEPGVDPTAPLSDLWVAPPPPVEPEATTGTGTIAGTPDTTTDTEMETCLLVSPDASLAAGTHASFACTNIDTEPFSFGISELTPGWEWAAAPGSDCASVEPEQWSTEGGAIYGPVEPADDATICVFLRPATQAPDDLSNTGSLQFTFYAGAGAAAYEPPRTATLGATRAEPATAPSATDLDLVCAALTGASTGEPVEVNCSFTGRPSLGASTVTVDSVTATAPGGWTFATPMTSGLVDGATVTLGPLASISAGESASFSLFLSPACEGSGQSSQLQIASTFTFDDTPALEGPGASVELPRTSGSQSVLVTSAPLAWQPDRSSGELTLHGTFSYQVQNTGCAGWDVTLTAAPFDYDGDHDGATISPANIAFSSSGVTPASGVSATESGTLEHASTVLTAPAGSGIGIYYQSLDLVVTVPANVAPGTYSTMLTVTIASGSDPE